MVVLFQQTYVRISNRFHPPHRSAKPPFGDFGGCYLIHLKQVNSTQAMNSYIEPMNVTVWRLQMLVAAADLGSFSCRRADQHIAARLQRGDPPIEEELGGQRQVSRPRTQ